MLNQSKVDQLKSPARIINQAQIRFGMLRPTTVHYLHPTRAVRTGDSTQKAQIENVLGQWDELKRLQAALP